MNNVILSELVTSIILGGAVGYATNDLAIKMLFQKYFNRFGGVIKDHYGEFITSMSQLVEADLVNHKTLENEFNSDTFKKVLQKWISDILLQELPKNSGTIRFQDIPGIDQSVQNLISLATTVQNPLFKGLYSEISKKELGTIISKEQYEYIINKNIPHILRNKGLLENDIKQFFCNFLSKHTINTLVSDRALQQIIDNINKVIQKTDIARFDDDLNNAYDELLTAVNIDSIIADISSELGDMKWSDFVKDSEHLSCELITKLLDFIKSDDAQKLLTDLVTEILKDAENIDLKIEEVVSPEIKTGLVKFIIEKLPGIINKIADIIRNSRTEIEEIIDKTLERELNSSGIDGQILLFVKNIFIDSLIGNIAEEANIVKIIIDEINNKGNEIGENLSMQILEFIETNTLGKIIGWACRNMEISPMAITSIINNNIKQINVGKNYEFIDNFLNEKIGTHLGIIDLSILKTKVLPAIFEEIKKYCLYTDQFSAGISKGIDVKLKEIAAKKISKIFDLQTISIRLNEKTIQDKFIKIGDNILKTEIRSILGLNAADNITVNLKPVWENNKHRELNDLYKIAQNESSYQKIATGILDILNQNLEGLLINNVSTIVNKELSKSNSDEINVMVKNFMGRELKPINIIGLALGAIMGGISVYIAAKLSLPNEPVWYMFPIYAAIFALVGIGTNAIAIRMLFRPYKSLKGLNFSPFIGLAAAKKTEFAVNISKFVKENTLNDEILLDTFNSNKNNLKSAFEKHISDSNYKIIDTFLTDTERLNSINIFIFSAIKKYFVENSKNISELICSTLRSNVESGKLNSLLPTIKEAIISKVKETEITSYVNEIFQNEIANKNIWQYSKIFSSLVDVQVKNFLKTLSNDLTVDNLKNLICKQNNIFMEYIKSHTFTDLAGGKLIGGIASGIDRKMNNVIDYLVCHFVDYIKKQKFDPSQKLCDVFGGALIRIVDGNIDFALTRIISDVKKNRDTIKNKICKKIDDAPLLLSVGLKISGAKKHAGRLVDMLLDEELPPFIISKQKDFLYAANTLLDNRLGSLGFSSESFNTESVKTAVYSVMKSTSVQVSLSHITNIFVRKFAKMPIDSLLKVLNISNIQDLLSIIDPILQSSFSKLKDVINKNQVASISVKHISNITTKIAGDLTIKDLLAGVDMEKELDNIIKMIMLSDAISIIEDIIDPLLYAVVSDNNFYNSDILCKDLTLFFDSYSENEWLQLQNITIPVINEILIKLNVNLTKEMKDAICKEYLFKAILSSCEYNFNDIIHAIDIQNVVEREINNMHPKQVEKMFYKFAGTYFNKLIAYGWIGSAGGLISYAISCFIKVFLK
ncbi:MAG: hypothetical protein Ta2B_26570 [Termitinemataceae bacterium]|nr:MAG: hypothetical protein Ta2B_26570 [Termitinemataceae bacterium]